MRKHTTETESQLKNTNKQIKHLKPESFLTTFKLHGLRLPKLANRTSDIDLGILKLVARGRKSGNTEGPEPLGGGRTSFCRGLISATTVTAVSCHGSGSSLLGGVTK